MSVSFKCLPEDPTSSLDCRRVQALRAPPTPLLDSSAARFTRCATKLRRSPRSSDPSSSLGGSFPSLLSPNSLSSHLSSSATGKLATFGSQHFTHGVTAATQQYPPHHHLNPVSHLHYGEVFSTLPQSNIQVPSLPPLTSTLVKGSGAMVHQNDFQQRSTICSVAAPLPLASPMASQTYPRRTPGGYINKSVQNLLRRGKPKQSNLDTYPSLPLVSSNVADEPRAHKSNSSQSLNKPAVLSAAYAPSVSSSSCRSTSTQSINSSTPSPLRYNAYAAEQESLQCRSIFGGSLKSTRSFHSSMDSDASYSPLATPTFSNIGRGAHSPLPGGQTAILTGALLVSDKLDFAGHHANVKISIAKSCESLAPSSDLTEESDDDESELEDIVVNLRSIAASRSSKGQQWEFDSRSSLDRNMESGISSDHSVDRSDSGSEFSFDAAVDEEDGADFFPLPSWPTLGSTSQSPLNKRSSRASIRFPPKIPHPVKQFPIRQ